MGHLVTFIITHIAKNSHIKFEKFDKKIKPCKALREMGCKTSASDAGILQAVRAADVAAKFEIDKMKLLYIL